MSFIPLFINSYDNSFIWDLNQIPITHGVTRSGCASASRAVSHKALEALLTLSGCWSDGGYRSSSGTSELYLKSINVI